MDEKVLLEAADLLDQAEQLLDINEVEEAKAKIAAAKEAIKRPIGGGTTGPSKD